MQQGNSLTDSLPQPESHREFRRHPRKSFLQAAKILVQGSAPADIALIDLSKGGLGARLAQPVPVRHSCVVALEVMADDKLRKVNVWGTVVYCEPSDGSFRVGIRYIDCDTMSKIYLSQVCEQVDRVAI